MRAGRRASISSSRRCPQPSLLPLSWSNVHDHDHHSSVSAILGAECETRPRRRARVRACGPYRGRRRDIDRRTHRPMDPIKSSSSSSFLSHTWDFPSSLRPPLAPRALSTTASTAVQHAAGGGNSLSHSCSNVEQLAGRAARASRRRRQGGTKGPVLSSPQDVHSSLPTDGRTGESITVPPQYST